MAAEGVEHPGRADAARNRAALVAAAAEVLATSPGASLAEVAARAGLGRATLYRHFDSRESLRAAIREEALSRASAVLADLSLEDCSTREGVRRATAALVPVGLRFRTLLAEGADTDPEFLAARDRTLAPLTRLVQRGVAAGEFRPGVDPRWLGMVLAGLLTTAVRAAGIGAIGADQAGELVSRGLFDGFGND
jgi:AcrR family transcriptional regulator